MAHPDTLSEAQPQPQVTIPMSSPGDSVQFSFTTMEGLVGHFSQVLPPRFVHNLIETEKEIFVVRRDCSLQETRLQFLKKCENALLRALAEVQSGHPPVDWTYSAGPG